MTDSKVVTLFGDGISTSPQPPSDRDLFGSIREVRGKVVFLDEADWHEDSLLRVVARNSVSAVVDMRSRPVFRLPRYRHRRVVSYFHRHGIQYLELINVLRDIPAAEKRISVDLTGVVFSRAEHGLTICVFDNDTKERGWIDSIRALMISGTNHLVELHPRALAGSSITDPIGY
jgi:hypothetical protein